MPLVTSRQMLLDAQQGEYAVGAFNVENMEMAMAVVEAASRSRAPVIVQTTPSTLRYADLSLYIANVAALAGRVDVPVAMHLDHGNSFGLAARAIREGYTSLMFDGSHSPLEENIAMTKQVVEMAQPNNIPVEAELGKVGGREDDLDGGDGGYTNPAEAVEFVEKTGVTSLAVAIGTAHGFYSGTPRLDVERLKEIRKVVSIPLVLHGASGLSDGDVRRCIGEGICKVNFATELRTAYTGGIKQVLGENPDTYDPKAYGIVARQRVLEQVMNRMAVCGCTGKY